MILQNSYKLQLHFFTLPPPTHSPNDADIQVWTSEFLPHRGAYHGDSLITA